MDDSDFKNFLSDADFLAALNWFGSQVATLID
jgi:hypothetical protein